MKTFLSEVLAGREAATAIDDWVEAWHTGEGEGLELYEFLGMTWDEYGDWARFPGSLATIIHTRQELARQGSPERLAESVEGASRESE